MSDVTSLLQAMDHGNAQATEQLFQLVYDELRQMAHRQLAQEKPGQTLQPTALVHEAWLRLAQPLSPVPGRDKGTNRRYFFAAAAEAMRRILIEQARAKGRLKRGGAKQQVELADVADTGISVDEVLDLDTALTALALVDPVKAELVKLRYFAGLDESEAAECLEISRATASRYWTFARAWMFDYLQSEKIPDNHEAWSR